MSEGPDAENPPSGDPNAWAYEPQPVLPPRAEAGGPAGTDPAPGPEEVPPELVEDIVGIRKGELWGRELTGGADESVLGTDSMLATQYRATPDAVIAFSPTTNSDLARVLGLATDTFDTVPEHVLPLDVIDLGNDGVAVNAAVLGISPEVLGWGSPSTVISVEVDGDPVFKGRATTVVVANGQFLHGNDLVPRGHPGDGRLEVQVYSFGRSERKKLRPRLANGSHLPHRKIRERSGRQVVVTAGKAFPLELDGRSGGLVAGFTASVRPGALRLAY